MVAMVLLHSNWVGIMAVFCGIDGSESKNVDGTAGHRNQSTMYILYTKPSNATTYNTRSTSTPASHPPT